MTSTDPRDLGGNIVGPDNGPHARGSVVLDTSKAILLEDVTVSTVDPDRGGRGQLYLALMLAGRINQTPDDARALFIMNTDGAAAIVTQLLALLARAKEKPGVIGPFIADLRRRLDELDAEGALEPMEDA